MARTQVVIVYSPNQARRRTVILPHDDADLPIHTRNIAKGEAVLVASLADYQAIGPDALLAKHLGRPATTDRCAVVDHAGIIRHVIAADPAIDSHPDGSLHLDHQAVAQPGQHAREVGLIR